MAKRYLLDFEKPLVELEKQIEQIKELARDSEVDVSQQLLQLETLAARRREEIFKSLTPAQKIQVARHPQRPSTLDFVQMFCDDWIELHGDRNGGDDMALIGGIGSINHRPVLMLGHQKGRDTKENVVRNFGMAKPGGYRKALRLMQHANRFSLPILTFIDTPGAYAGLKAEEQGQGEAIARNLREMFGLKVPIVATVIGEGGSGGALGIGVADRLLMFEHSVYTVASPEACASILWRDAAKAPEAASALKITGKDLLKLGIIDEVLPEPSGGNNWAPLDAGNTLKEAIEKHLNALLQMPEDELIEERYKKFRVLGKFIEANNLEEIYSEIPQRTE
ncbi:acetyl-CoA carboxylase carboxyltransferase subunit alpha [Prochlorococcus marinus]|uniref:Acetyl-coenzyme A carboxylase carboxyl transferase subunit alpha n=1 Tax=Prochlorococcus marinus str. SB TaxID=59926 RepID=A0A0A2B5W7_PROMR|nr:acetyl-CoA carboxylase carboxyltransferase subunit alpha [Prochlorococcus marinus]KGG07994.1 Acetyl-coenzyme A carboxyl transferase alpha chain [Prochlorococcus marinus str. SB]